MTAPETNRTIILLVEELVAMLRRRQFDEALPALAEEWTERHCNGAYRILAQVSPCDVEPNCMAGLMFPVVGSYEFAAICKKSGPGSSTFLASIFNLPGMKLDAQAFAQLVL